MQPREFRLLDNKYLQFEDLGLEFYESRILLPQETKKGKKTLLSQSADSKKKVKKQQLCR